MWDLQQCIDRQIGPESFCEWHHEMRRVLPCRLHDHQHHRDQNACRDLQTQLRARSQAQIAMMDNLQVIVGKSNCSEGQSGNNGNPNVQVLEVRPEHGGHNNRNHDEHSPHSGSASFLLMRCRTLFPNVLPDLELTKLADDSRTHNQSHEQCGQTCKSSTKGDVAENAKRRKECVQPLIEQPIQQSSSVSDQLLLGFDLLL